MKITTKLGLVCGLALGAGSALLAQNAAVQPRLTKAVDNTQVVQLRGNVRPEARAAFDRGAAPAGLALHRMLLLLKRSPQQELALRQLIEDQQTPGSPQYHRWLTPQQFGQQYGPAPADIQAVSNWLVAQGFTVDQVAPGGNVIEFSGTAGAVESSLHTAIHRYVVNGVEHWANATNPAIPAALAPVVAGVVSLNNFVKPAGHLRAQGSGVKATPGQLSPSLTFQDNNGQVEHAMVPADFATLYNVSPLYGASPAINGQGQTIAIVGRSDVDLNDIRDFRSLFVPSNPANLPQVVLNGPDPGNLGGGDEGESDLDLEWSGAVAPNATIDFVVSSTTDTTDGVDLSAEYIVDHNLAPVMSTSFAACEAELGGAGSAEINFIGSLYEQAAAQGITVIDSSGDSGAAGCDPNDGSETTAVNGQGVSALSSTPFDVAVGGTQFNEGGGTYWNNTNSSTNFASATGPIPETVWNESCLPGNNTCDSSGPLSASGGGASIVYTKPSWQSGITGMPNDGARDVPDLSFSAAGHDGYVACQDGSCELGQGGTFNFYIFAGTSASAPSFAGVMALVNQEIGSIQGQANYVLYGLAKNENWSACNSATGAAANCIFLDTTVGNNSVPGVVGFNAGVGYDEATGLGSINVANLVNNWHTAVPPLASTTTLALSPTSITHGGSVNINVVVTQSGGAIGPSGDVSLIAQTGGNGLGVDFGTLTLGGASCGTKGCLTGVENGLPGGTYNVVARYNGDGSFAPSLSNPVSVTVNPEASVTQLGAFEFDQFGNEDQVATVYYGDFVYLDAFVQGAAGAANNAGCQAGTATCLNDGIPTGTVSFLNSGNALSIPGVSSTLALNTEGEASFPNGITNLTPGTYSLTGAYNPAATDPNGAASFMASTSAAVPLTVVAAPTGTTITQNTISGNSLTLATTIATNSFGAPPTGTVAFFSGTTQIGSGAVAGTTNSTTGIAAGTATATIAAAPAGQDSITAQYSGDANYAASTSPAVIVTIGAAGGGFTLSASPTTTTVAAGSSAAFTLALTPNNGFSGNVTFACSGAPGACTFTPATVALSGTASTSITMNVATSAGSVPPFSPPATPRGWMIVAGLGLLATLFALGLAWPRRRWRLALPAAVALIALAAAGCGGGSSAPAGTTPSTFSFSVTATSGTVTATQNLTVIVN